MSEERAFQLAFIACFVVAVAVAVRAARRARVGHGAALNQLAHEARGLVPLRAALGLVFYGALAIWLARPDAQRWAYWPAPSWLRWSAVACTLPALLCFAASYRALGDGYRGGVGLYDDHELATGGPFAVVRHPIYLCFIALMALVLVFSANWVLGGTGLLLVTSIAAVRIPIEERELAARFGERWSAYAARTPAGWPIGPVR